ncbi:MAG: hypothetical protein J0I32_23415 [Sphingobacteriales bacterium]|nr:hypothetical protein [Sphingobacteriales bacterium]OJW01991.1 MAG: hypothetical protein BGO52_00470 [Sphingobacteriales bacterium 44-61]
MLVISWNQYLGTAAVLLVLYYAFVLLVFNRRKAGSSSRPNRSVGSAKKPAATPADRALFQEDDKQEAQLDAASAAPMHSLVDELQAYVAQAGKQQIPIEEVKSGVRSILQKYPAIPGSIFQPGISNLLEVIIENNCGVRLSGTEIRELWVAG